MCHEEAAINKYTKFHVYMSYHYPVSIISSFFKETLPEAICCSFNLIKLYVFILLIEYFMCTKFCLHSSYHI